MSRPTPARRRGAHRDAPGLHRPAALLTTAIAGVSVGLAAFAATTPGVTLDATRAEASLSTAGPAIGTAAVDRVATVVQQPQGRAAAPVRLDQLVLARDVVADSTAAGQAATDLVQQRSEEIAERRAEARRQAEEEARREAEAAAAAEAEREEQAEAEAEQQAASRSSERESAPAPAPAPSGDPRSTARSMLSSYGWGDDQWGCLESLWQKESGWNPTAQNPSSGAYGIPQALPGSKMASAGSDWATNPATQIRWGLGYIQGRYGSPCGAWSHSQSVGWY